VKQYIVQIKKTIPATRILRKSELTVKVVGGKTMGRSRLSANIYVLHCLVTGY